MRRAQVLRLLLVGLVCLSGCSTLSGGTTATVDSVDIDLAFGAGSIDI